MPRPTAKPKAAGLALKKGKATAGKALKSGKTAAPITPKTKAAPAKRPALAAAKPAEKKQKRTVAGKILPPAAAPAKPQKIAQPPPAPPAPVLPPVPSVDASVPPSDLHRPKPGESKGDWFSRIARDYYRFLFSVALPITRNPADAEDAVQTAVMNALKRLDQLTEYSAVISWLAMITRNSALDLLRQRKRQPGGGGDAGEIGVAAPAKDDSYAMAADVREILAQAIATLPPGYQEVVNRRHFDGLEISQIAVITGVSENNVRVRLFRAYDRLRESKAVRDALGLPPAEPQKESSEIF